MAIAYTIKPGYNPNHSLEKVGERLHATVQEIRQQPSMIAQEVLRCSELFKLADLDAYCACYLPSIDNCTIKCVGTGETACVLQFASGGGLARTIKEHCRRAFVRIVINEMHRHEMEVSLEVT